MNIKRCLFNPSIFSVYKNLSKGIVCNTELDKTEGWGQFLDNISLYSSGILIEQTTIKKKNKDWWKDTYTK